MNINILKGTTPLFTRDVSVGGNQYTDSLQKELDLSFEDAEALKLGQKLAPSAKTPSCRSCSRSPRSSSWRFRRLLTSSAPPRPANTSSAFTWPVDRHKVPGLIEALRQEFSLPVEVLNPFQRIIHPPADGARTDRKERGTTRGCGGIGPEEL